MGDYMAAVLACGEGAVLSATGRPRTSLRLTRLQGRHREVTVPTTGGGARAKAS